MMPADLPPLPLTQPAIVAPLSLERGMRSAQDAKRVLEGAARDAQHIEIANILRRCGATLDDDLAPEYLIRFRAQELRDWARPDAIKPKWARPLEPVMLVAAAVALEVAADLIEARQ